MKYVNEAKESKKARASEREIKSSTRKLGSEYEKKWKRGQESGPCFVGCELSSADHRNRTVYNSAAP